MTEIPDPIRRAMEAQAARTGKIDVAAVEAALADYDPIPTDAEEIAKQGTAYGPPKTPAGPENAAHGRTGGIQTTIEAENLRPLRYEELLPAADVATYKKVKRWTMTLATDARTILAEMTGGEIGDGGRSKKEFLTTGRGKWRVAMGHNSDNTTEVEALRQMGVDTLHLDAPAEVLAFFAIHDLPARESYDALVRRLTRRY